MYDENQTFAQLQPPDYNTHHDHNEFRPAGKRPVVLTASTPVPARAAHPRLDAVILSCADAEWRKVAMLIARTTDAAREQSIDATTQSIAERIYALTDAHRLEVKGNVRRWRTTEIRLAGAA